MRVGKGLDPTRRLPAPPPNRMRADPRSRTAVDPGEAAAPRLTGGEHTVWTARRPLFRFAQELLHLFPLEILL